MPARPCPPRRAALAVALALTALAAVLLAGAAPARAVELGVSDSDAPTVVEQHWPGLGINRARVVVPYDVALTRGAAGVERRRRFEAFRANAAARGVELLVVFSASVDVLAPGTNAAVAPTADEYAAGFAAFRARYPDVTLLGAWNEPNNPDQRRYPLASDPWLAAEYWLRAQGQCPGCTVLAGEFAGIAGDDAYVDAYLAALGGARPAVWGVHAHSDVNAFQAGGADSARVTRYYLGKLQGEWAGGRIWIDEVGARFRSPRYDLWGDESQARATQFLLGLATLDARIERIYYYNFSNQCATPARCAVQDRGLVSPSPWDGLPLDYDASNRPRAAYGVIAARGPAIPPAEPVPPVVTIDAPQQNGAVPTATPAFSGQAAVGGHAAGEVTLDVVAGAGSTEGGAPLQRLTAAVVDGRWSVTSAPLADGVYTARAAQAGNRTSEGISQDVVFTVDTVAPKTTIATAPPAATGAREARFGFAASEPGVRFACSVDRGRWAPCGAATRLRSLALGRHTLAVRATDAAGNVEPAPVRHSWRRAVLAGALAPRALPLAAAFSAQGVPLAAACAGPCRVTARLYAPRAQAKQLGLWRRAVSRRDPARPRGRGWIVVAGSSLTRSRAGAGTLALRLRAGSSSAWRAQASLPLRLGITLDGRGGQRAVVRERVALARSGTLRSVATRGLPVTVACSFACDQRTQLWTTEPFARTLDARGARVRGSRANGLPRGAPYVALQTQATRRTRAGGTRVGLLPDRRVRARLGRAGKAGLRVTARLAAPGAPARVVSWPLTLAAP